MDSGNSFSRIYAKFETSFAELTTITTNYSNKTQPRIPPKFETSFPDRPSNQNLKLSIQQPSIKKPNHNNSQNNSQTMSKCFCVARTWAKTYESVCMRVSLEDGELCKTHQTKQDNNGLHLGTIHQERPEKWGIVAGEKVDLVKSLHSSEGKTIAWGNDVAVEDWDKHRQDLKDGVKAWGDADVTTKSKKKTVKKTVIKKSSGDKELDEVIDTKETLKNLKEELKDALDNIQRLKEKVDQAELDYEKAKINLNQMDQLKKKDEMMYEEIVDITEKWNESVEEKDDPDEQIVTDPEKFAKILVSKYGKVAQAKAEPVKDESEEEEKDESEVEEKDESVVQNLIANFEQKEEETLVKQDSVDSQATLAFQSEDDEPIKEESDDEPIKEESDDEDEDEDFKMITVDGREYQWDKESNAVIDVDTYEEVGTYDKDTDKIDFYDDSDDE